MKKITFLLLFAVIAFTVHAQIITTLAGNGVAGFSGDGGAATAAEFNLPSGVAFDNSGNMYIAVRNNDRIRKISASGIISTVAGGGSSGLGDGGQATAAQLNTPYDVVLDNSGNIYIADASDARIRKVTASTGVITTIAGNGHAGYTGDGSAATAAELNNPIGIALDASGNVYVAEQGNSVIRMINTSGTISTFAGNGVGGYSGDGGAATSAEIRNPYTVTVDIHGNVYIADKMNFRVRKVTAGTITTIAGNGTSGSNGNNGQATAAELTFPTGVVADPSGIVYVIDGGANRVRKINNSGVITALAGHGSGGFSGDGGQATSAELSGPMKAAFDNVGNLYITDQSNNRIREVYLVLNVSTSVSANVSCSGGADGGASVTASNGTTPYTYSWSCGGTNASNITLSAGTFTINVTDNDGVTGSATVTITQPGKPLSLYANATATVTCYGGNNGSIAGGASNGTSPYTYSWSPGGQTTATVTGRSAGTYTLTVTDNHGCTATSSATIIQPAVLAPVIGWATNVSCAGLFDGMAIATASGGTLPYTYSWNTGATTATISGLSAGTYSVGITDAYGCTGSTSVNITQPPVLTVTTTNISSIAYAVTSGGTPPYSFTWKPGGSTSSIASGLSAGTYTVFVTDANGCADSTVLTLSVAIHIPKSPYPRWSKRGVWLGYAANMIDSTYNVHDNQITPFVTYCRDNQIDYVNLDGLDAGTSATNWVFGTSTVGVDSLNALQLEDFIDSLKTRGHVSQVGIVCFNSKYSASNVTLYDIGNFSNSVSMFNSELPWRKRVDVLSMDEEFWNPGNFISPSYAVSLNDFHTVHMQFLKSMYSAARKCPTNYLRVEDYIAPPLDINAYLFGGDSVLYTNKTQSMEIDSIGLYADRILLSSYTKYPNVLWNRGDWMQADSEIGLDKFGAYYKKEIWPIFDPSSVEKTCKYCYDIGDSESFLGAPMCDSGVNPTYMEQRYYGELNYGEHFQKWTDDNLTFSQWNSMGKDTNFQVWGCMWYEYSCLQNWKFDTNTHNIKTNIPFYVTLDHDTVWHGTPITLYANVHDAGGSPFLYYIWRNMDSAAKDSVLFSAINNNALTIDFPTRVSVEVVGLTYGDTLMATDYVNVISNCYGYTGINYIKRQNLGVKIYPNPSNGMFTIEMINNDGKAKNLYVYNMMGQELKSQELRENSSVIDLSGQPSGVYFCRVTDVNGTLLKAIKIMIIH